MLVREFWREFYSVQVLHRYDILAQLCVDGQDLGVAHKGERQDGDGVGRLKMNPNRSP